MRIQSLEFAWSLLEDERQKLKVYLVQIRYTIRRE